MRSIHALLSTLLYLVPLSTSYNVGYVRRTVSVKLPDDSQQKYPTTPDATSINVPVSIWSPTDNQPSSLSTPVEYDYTIDIRSIARLLLGLPLPSFSFLRKTIPLPSPPNVLPESIPPTLTSLPIIVFNHGYLGSRLDLHPLLSNLSSHGIICVSPDYPETLSGSYPVPPTLTRTLILTSVLSTVRSLYPVSNLVGLIGHSLGSSITSTYDTGNPTSPRCCIAGFRGADDTSETSPFLVIASDGDGVCPSEFVKGRVEDMKMRGSNEVKGIYLSSFNHIDFLSSGTNDAMVDFLSPLLPIARTLKVPLLDFDKYAEIPKSEECRVAIEGDIIEFFKDNLGVKP